LIPFGAYLSSFTKGGEEHRVRFDEQSDRYWKATYPGRSGYTMIAAHDGLVEMVHATPLEYLERLLLQNRLFGDDNQLEAISEEPGGMVILTSQRNIPGTDATLTEIELYFRSMWFQPLHGLNVANPGSLSFYRDLDEIAIFDAHRANLVKHDTGHIIPIDLILVRADEALQ